MRKLFFIFIILVCFVFIVVAAQSFELKGMRKAQADSTTQSIENWIDCNHDDSVFCSHLPLLNVNTRDQNISKTEHIFVELQVFDSANSNNHLEDNATHLSEGSIKFRGNSSYSIFDKKSYRIEFYLDNDSTDYALFGMAPDKEWVLYGPFLDRSLMRNRLMYTLSKEIMPWSPDTRFFELFVDDIYRGVYLAVEPVTNTPSRLDLRDFGLITGETAYVFSRERDNTEPNEINTYAKYMGHTSLTLSIDYPSYKKITKRQTTWIEKDISEFERVLYSDDFTGEEGYAKYIDVDTFVDYYLLNEFAMITDASYLSTYCYKNINDKIKITVWDFNNGFNNYPWYSKEADKDFLVASSNWYNRLFQDPAFTDAVVARYRELRKDKWTTERIMDFIDSEIDALGPAIERNMELWGYTFNQALMTKGNDGKPRDPRSFEEAVNMLKSTIITRLEFMDLNIEKLYLMSLTQTLAD